MFFDAGTEPPSPRSVSGLSRSSMGAESFTSAMGPSELEGGSPRQAGSDSTLPKGAPLLDDLPPVAIMCCAVGWFHDIRLP